MDSLFRKQLPLDWRNLLKEEAIESDNFDAISSFISESRAAGKIIHPSDSKIFHAFEITKISGLKVIILGQDPYHGQGQAMGLSFSVPRGMKIPPSLRNIFRELMTDEKIDYPNHGDLTKWAEQGVLLLNSVLTVEHAKAASHSKIGWEKFTDKVIKVLSDKKENLVFMLWGNFAKSKKPFIDSQRHLVLEAAHPSPLARNKFQNCQHFSKANEYLVLHDCKPIDWKLD